MCYKTNAAKKYEMIGINSIDIAIFLTAMAAFIEGKASLIRC